MHPFILSVQGRNRTGIVAEVARLLYQLKANIMDSSMTTLRSEFVMMLVVELPEALAPPMLEAALASLRESGLNAVFKPLSSEEAFPSDATSYPTHTLSVLGRDRTGIVYRISEVLSQQGINITDVNTQLMDAEEPKLYAMILELHVPEAVDIQALDRVLKSVAEELNVDINLHPVEFAEL